MPSLQATKNRQRDWEGSRNRDRQRGRNRDWQRRRDRHGQGRGHRYRGRARGRCSRRLGRDGQRDGDGDRERRREGDGDGSGLRMEKGSENQETETEMSEREVKKAALYVTACVGMRREDQHGRGARGNSICGMWGKAAVSVTSLVWFIRHRSIAIIVHLSAAKVPLVVQIQVRSSFAKFVRRCRH